MAQVAKPQSIAEELGVRYIAGPAYSDVLFTFVTLVARQASYDRMLTSARNKGFSRKNSEFFALDNRTGNRFDGFDAMRRAIVEARGQYIVFTHDDVEFLYDGAAELSARLEELSRIDPGWTLAGNAGGVRDRRRRPDLAIHIDDPHGADQRVEKSQLVESLDENFVVMRRERPVVNSYDLQGFHLYASDLCRLSEIMGGRNYVIPFLLRHHSGGLVDGSFPLCRDRFQRKYRRYFIGRSLQMTVGEVHFGLAGLRDAWRETAAGRWKHIRTNVCAPEDPGR